MDKDALYKIEITFNSGATFTMPNMGEEFVFLINEAKNRNEIFEQTDARGNVMVLDMTQVSMIRSLKNNY